MNIIRSLAMVGVIGMLLRNAPEADSAAAGGTEAAAPATPAQEKKERVRKNGQTRPDVGSKTGLIWDFADSIVASDNRVPTKDEVWAKYKPVIESKGETPSETTLATQYGRWVIFHGYQQHVKANRAAARAAKDAGDVEAKAEAARLKEEEKAKKAAEKEAAKAKKVADREAAKAAKEAAKAAKNAPPAPEDGQVDAAANATDGEA